MTCFSPLSWFWIAEDRFRLRLHLDGKFTTYTAIKMGHLFSFPADLSSAIDAAWRNLKQADSNASALNKTFEVFYKDCGVVVGHFWRGENNISILQAVARAFHWEGGSWSVLFNLFLKGSQTAGKTRINVNSIIKSIKIQLTFSCL